MNWKRLLLSLIGIALFIFILSRVDIHAIFSTIGNANPWPLLAAVILSIIMVLLKTLRWRTLLKAQKIEYKLRDAFPAYLASCYLGLVTPGKLGDMSRALYLRNDLHLPVGKALSSVILDRLFDLYILILIASYGLFILTPLEGNLALYGIILTVILIIPALALNKRSGKVLGGIVSRFKPQIDQFYSGISMLTTSKLVLPSAITIIAYAICFTQYYLLTLALGLSISFFTLMAYMAIVSLVELMPISIAGLGTRDATLIALFSLQSISAESALSYSLLVLFAFHILGAVLGIIAWQIKPLRITK